MPLTASGKRAFSARHPFPRDPDGRKRLPRVLRETTTFVLMEENIKTEGIFRISPHSKLVGILREAYDRGQKFIVWKDNGLTLPSPKYEGAEDTEAIIDEIDPQNAYGVVLASSLIKLWYKELRQPIFPQSCYGNVKSLFGHSQEAPTVSGLCSLISPLSGTVDINTAVTRDSRFSFDSTSLPCDEVRRVE